MQAIIEKIRQKLPKIMQGGGSGINTAEEPEVEDFDLIPASASPWKIEKPLLLGIIVLLIALFSFGLGRLSKDSESKEPITIVATPEQTSAVATNSISKPITTTPIPTVTKVGAISGQFVAAESGTRYYLPTCSGVSRIKEENKIWFTTKADAEKAGRSEE